MTKVINGGNGMSTKKAPAKNIFADIEAYSKQKDTEQWNGTVQDYIELVQAQPKLAQLAHSRVLDMIESAGIEYNNHDTAKEFPKYNFFANDLFGIDVPVVQFLGRVYEQWGTGSGTLRE